MNTSNAQAAVWVLLGQDSFTAGVIAGVVKSIAVSILELVKLYQMFALAEYWESKHNHSFWMRIREAMLMTNPIGQSINNLKTGFAVAEYFWPDFDKLARKAYDDRQALFEGLEYAFTHIGEVFGSIPKSLEDKWHKFRAYMEARTLKGNFLAGVMVGEILLDVLLLIDVATGVVVLIRAVPKLGRMVVDLARLAKAAQGAGRGVGGGAPKVATEALEGTTHSIFDAGRGTPPKSVEPPKLPEPPKSPPPPKVPSYRLGQSDGGPGVWGENPRGYPKNPADAAYQQEVTGAPKSVEYKVPADKNIKASGEKWFDGYDPESGNLLEGKNYKDWPKKELPFSMKATTTEMIENDKIASDLGKTVEYRVATQEKASLLQKIADDAGLENTIVKYHP